MRKIMGIGIVVAALLVVTIGVAVTYTGCFAPKPAIAAGDENLYTCGMHPWVVQKGPGQCPICGMNLVPKETGANASNSGERHILYWVSSMDPNYIRQAPGKDAMGMDLVPVYEDEVADGSSITVDPSIIQSIGVRYSNIQRGPMTVSIRAPAHVDYNEDNLAVLSTRTEGYIDRLYVTSPGTNVKAGDPLFDFSAPKLYSAQEEYLIALRAGDSRLSSAARERLKLLGVSDVQIDGIRRNGSSHALTITAPMDGTVVAMGGSGGVDTQSQGGGLFTSGGMSGGGQTSGGGGMSGMGGGGSMTGGGFSDSGGSGGIGAGMASGSGGSLREGSYVSAGAPVFTIADLSTVWVYAHIFDNELPFVHVGMPARLELDYLPGQTFEGVVDFFYPYLQRSTRDIRIRLVFPNADGRLLPEMYGKVTIESQVADDALTIPEEAVIFSGDRRIVFLALPGGKFAPVEVTVGPSDGNGNAQVLSGLVEGQQIVTSAQFLLDAESRMQEAINKMLSGQANPATPEEVTSTGYGMPTQSTAEEDMQGMEMSSGQWPNLAPDDPDAKWRCPMPDDRYYAAEPDKCPICEMNLKPNDPQAWVGKNGVTN